MGSLRHLGATVGILLAAAAGPVACGSGGANAEPGSAEINPEVSATVQTSPVPHTGDAADDVAIWVDPADPSRSTIIGTDKKGGLIVYDLAGKVVHEVPDGPMNNVDVRAEFPLAGRKVALVAASQRDEEAIALYRVDPVSRALVPVSSRPIRLSIGAYGLCMYHSRKTGRFYVFVDSEKGEVEQWQLFESRTKKGKVDANRVRAFDVGSQTEGCVADDARRRFYIGEEDVAIWRYGAEPGAGTARTRVDSTGGGHLAKDIEGLTIAPGPGVTGYLVASSQGSNSFAVYRREGANDYLGSFEIVEGDGIGGVEETDGIDVTTADLGPQFPQGVFVAQDGKNGDENQDFKLVPWQAVVRPAG